MENELAVEAIGLEKAYGRVRVLDGVDLGVARGSVFALLGRALVGEQDRGGRHQLHVDAVSVHVGHADVGVPAGRRDRAELAVSHHHGGVVRPVTSHPRPLTAEPGGKVRPRLREEVGVDVDDGHETPWSGGSGRAPRPGCTHPHESHVRAASSS